MLVASFANIFSYPVSFFVLFMVSLAVQKLLSLIRSHLLIFIFIVLGEGVGKILLQFILKSILLNFVEEFHTIWSYI